MDQRREIEKNLRADLDRAMSLYVQADAALDLIMAGLPTGLPQSESARRISEAGTAHTRALLGLNAARTEWNDLTRR